MSPSLIQELTSIEEQLNKLVAQLPPASEIKQQLNKAKRNIGTVINQELEK